MAWESSMRDVARLILPIHIRVATLFVAALVAACDTKPADETQPSADPEFAELDSAGVIIAQNQEVVTNDSNEWHIDPVPDLELGGITGTDPYLFADITGISSLSDGRIVVVNGGSRQIRYFDRSGTFLHQVGRQGEGPGEYDMVRLVSAFPGDSLLLFDVPARRVTVLGHDGQVRRVVSTSSAGSDIVIGMQDGRLVLRSTSLPRPISGAVIAAPVTLRLFDPATGSADTVAVVDGQAVYGSTDLNPGATTQLVVPFSIAPVSTVSPHSGSIYVVEAGRQDIMEYADSGQLRRVIRSGRSMAPITEADLTRFISARTAFQSSQPAFVEASAAAYRRIPLPPAIPVFQSVLVDELEYIWAELYRPFDETPAEKSMRFGLWSSLEYSPPAPTPAMWMVFSADGEALEMVEMPIGLEVHHIGADFVLGRWRDDQFGTEYVRRYPLTRGR